MSELVNSLMIMLFSFLFVAVIFYGAVEIIEFSNLHWTERYIDKPYCITRTIQKQEYMRCWKAVEILK